MSSVGWIVAGNVVVQGGERRCNWRSNNCVCFVRNAGRLRVAARGGFRLRAGKDRDSKDAGDELEGTDDRAQMAIEKSKKVLEMQNNLLEQIAKRRNLDTTISSRTSHEQQPDSDPNSDSNAEIGKPQSVDLLLETPSQKHISYKTPPISQNSTPITESELDSSISQNSTPITESELDSSISQNPTPITESKWESSWEPSTTTLTPPVQKFETQIDKKNPVVISSDKNTGFEEEKKEPGPLAGVNVMNIIVVAAECAPWSKTGGLGDVVGALPKALASRGHRVMVVVPRYGNYAEVQEIGVRKYYKVDGQDHEVNYYHAYIDGVDFVFIDCPFYRHRENDIYGGQRMDILKRMILLCKAAVEVPWHVPCGGVCYGDGNLAFIANDWHTALLPVYLKAYYRDNGLMQYTRSVLVIHNIAHQGRGPVDEYKFTDLPEHYLDLFRLYDPVGGDHLNIFMGGIKAADRVVTVSNGYAWEIKTVEGGWGLHDIINHNHWKLDSIVNGIDPIEWNPNSDVYLKSDGYTNYSLETLDKGKAQCKEALQRELGLEVRPDVPILGFIGRLDYQKGIDLIADAIPWITSQDVQVVMLGTGRQDLENLLRKLEGENRDKVRAWVGFSVPMAHRITAGADVIMMPSRFEPCGLNQLYAMVYGTVPVVHSVGGLRDTVVPFDPFGDTGLGWTFDRAEAGKLIDALGYCLNTYKNYKESWRGLQVRGMMQDLSWDVVAQKYEEVLVAAKYQW